MWDGLFLLLGLSIVMTVASFLAGALPLALSLSARKLRLITAIGTGVLVGTSLIVIIPEGVETLYAARELESQQATRAASLVATRSSITWHAASLHDQRDLLPRYPDWPLVHIKRQELSGPDDGHPSDSSQPDSIFSPTTPPTPTHDHTADWEPHAWIGISLILGFTLMYLIDTLPSHISRTSSTPKPSHISLNRFTLRHRGSNTQDTSSQDDDTEDFSAQDSHTRPSSTTVGLVIHGLADGIALGASSASGSSNRLGVVVFLALMLHKAPAAFGLTAALLKQGLSRRRARTHLIVFSLAAPVGAIVTWGLANVFGSGGAGEAVVGTAVGGTAAAGAGASNEGTGFATGVLLLFSGGTFLYVAMHTMQDRSSHNHAHRTAQNGYSEGNVYDGFTAPTPKEEGSGMLETFATVGGMLLPLLMQFGHAH